MLYHQVQGFLPIYGEDGGNYTLLIHIDGSTQILHLPLKTYLTSMYQQSHLDPKALQYWTHKLIGTKNNIPLTINEQFIFIPIKTRQSIGKSDGCFGYFLMSTLKSFDDYTLTLTSNYTLTTLSPKIYLIKKLRDAKLLAYAYRDERKQYEFMHH